MGRIYQTVDCSKTYAKQNYNNVSSQTLQKKLIVVGAVKNKQNNKSTNMIAKNCKKNLAKTLEARLRWFGTVRRRNKKHARRKIMR